ncbi:TPA: hypothetical protein ACHU97_002199, partial [Streptococcus suis]
FNRLFLELTFSISDKIFVVKRHDNHFELITDDQITQYILPAQHNNFLMSVLKTEKSKVVNNLLGAIYLDQDKGWTLLNRGKVIGGIPFNIEELIEGLTSIDISEYSDRVRFLEREINKLRTLKSVASYKIQYLENDADLPTDDINVIKEQIILISSQKRIYQNKLSQVNNLIKENKGFFKMLEDFHLEVSDKETGRIIPVTKSTIINYDDSYNFLDARKWIIKENISRLDEELSVAQNKLENILGQTSLFEDERSIEKAELFFNQIDVSYEEVDARIELLNKELKGLQSFIKSKLSENSEIVTSMSENILRYSKVLGISSIINKKSNFLFLSDLKKISGTQFHKLVICYKIAYIKEIEKFLGISLPIILDSPSGREVTKENLDKIYELLASELKENQIIIASIYKNPYLSSPCMIELNEEEKIFGISDSVLFK